MTGPEEKEDLPTWIAILLTIFAVAFAMAFLGLLVSVNIDIWTGIVEKYHHSAPACTVVGDAITCRY